MKKEFCIVIAALLVLSLTACGKSKSANSVPLVDCSDHGSAVEGGCYLMTEETPDEICEEAKVIFSENLAQWVSVFEGGAGEYALGTPYHTHPLDSNGKPTDAYIFPVLHNGEFWRTLDIIELDGETRHQFSPNVEKFQHLHGLSSPENPIRFVWVGNVRYAVVGNNAEIITHEGGRIPDNIGELAVQSDLPDSVVIDISKPNAVAEIATENMAVPNWDEICSSIRMLPQDFTFAVDLNDGSNVTVCGQKVSMQNPIIVPSADTVTVDTLRSEVLFPLQETLDLIGIAWDIQNDVLNMACQYHIEADYGKDLPHLCSVNMQTLQVYDRDGVSYMTLPQKAQEQNGVLYIPLSWLEQLFAFHVSDTELILDTEQYLAKQPIKSDDGTLKNWVHLSLDEIPERFAKIQTEDRNGVPVEVWSDGSLELRVFEGMNSVFSVTLLDDSHETKRGIRVGDSVDQLWEWYLEQQLDGMVTRNGKEESKQNQDKQQFALIPYVLSYTQDGGLLTSITISAPE